MNQYCQLSNPLCEMLDKPKEDFQRKDLLKVIAEKNIERITFHYTALDGKLKELGIPIHSMKHAENVLANWERVDGSSLFKGMIDDSCSDIYVVPVYKTAFLNPFDSGSIDFICRYLNKDGERVPFALDNILHNANAMFKKHTGFDFNTLGELEFYLMGEPNQSQIYLPEKQCAYHASSPFKKSNNILNEMVRYITQMTGAVKYTHSEVGIIENVTSEYSEINGRRAEQLEIEFLPRPVEEMADDLVLSRWIIRNVAYKYGQVATFTPKLEEGMAGSGYHIHMEAQKDGKNIMAHHGVLTDDAKKIIGGLCHYADSLTAFGNTVASSYLRLVPNQEAPTHICWGDTNRSAMIRVPLGWSKVPNIAQIFNPQQIEESEQLDERQTVEIRTPDGSANTHLLLAAITMAADWGLTHGQEALEICNKCYVQGNIFHNPERLAQLSSLPASCVDSAKALLAKRDYYEHDNIFPTSVIDYMVKLLNRENDTHLNEYLRSLPSADRLKEARYIMHKDLHRH